MAWASRVLPLQKLARTIDYWSKVISHVRGTRRFGPFWSRHYMDLYLGKRMAQRMHRHVQDTCVAPTACTQDCDWRWSHTMSQNVRCLLVQCVLPRDLCGSNAIYVALVS